MAFPDISKRVRIYLLLSSGFRRLSDRFKPLAPMIGRLEHLSGAVWLGLLDADRLNEVTRAYYMGGSGFDDQEFNVQSGLWASESDAVRQHFAGEKRVLVAGAGGGREVIALARLGYDVTGFDFSSTLTAACRRNVERAGCTARVLDAPPNGAPELDHVHDALLIGRGFYHHIPGRARRTAFLRACRAALKDGAPIILSDIFARPAQARPHQRIRAIANFVRRLRNDKELVELGDWLSLTMQHAFIREEIEQEFLDAGVTLESFTMTLVEGSKHLAHAIGRAQVPR